MGFQRETPLLGVEARAEVTDRVSNSQIVRSVLWAV